MSKWHIDRQSNTVVTDDGAFVVDLNRVAGRDAKVIAAAKDLLEALQDIKALVRDGYQHNDIAMTRSLVQAEAAIQKATARN